MKHILKEALNELKEMELVEDLKGWFKRNYGNTFGEIPEKQAFDKLLKVMVLDPTFKTTGEESKEELLSKQQGAYAEWLLRMIKKGYVSFDEMMANAHEYKDQLAIFDEQKKRNRLPSDKKDIMQFKKLEDLMNMLNSLGGTSDDGSHSDFKQDVSDIRGCLQHLIGLRDSEIPEDIQKTEDVLKYVGGNDKWEIWVPVNYYGTAILDRWGAGAGWCVGGMLGNNRGMEQIRQAKNYFNNYNGGGAQYVCFQQKDKNAPRPDNKYLITLGPNGSLPESHAGYQFNNASNQTQYISGSRGYGDDYQDSQMDAFANFLQEAGLTEIFKQSEFKDCACFLNIENKKRLDEGEPYRYVGGKIRPYFKDSIKEIVFEYDGKEHKVDAKEHPEYLDSESISDMINMENLINGEPFIFDSETASNKIKEMFRPLIKEIVIPRSYDFTVNWSIDGTMSQIVGIPRLPFIGCNNLTKITFYENIVGLTGGFYKISRGEDNPNVQLHTVKHKMKCMNDDVEFLKSHLHYDAE